MLFALFVLLVGAAVPAGAATIVLDFEEEATGYRTNPFTSAECGCVSFTHGNVGHPFEPVQPDLGLRVLDVGAQGDGLSLVVGEDDDGGGLYLRFAAPIASLSLAFGGDDPSILDPGREAVLQVYSGNTLIGETRVALNANNLMDQSISISGLGPFDGANFGFSDNIDEVVDNITFETVPEPGTVGLLVLSALAMAGCRRRG